MKHRSPSADAAAAAARRTRLLLPARLLLHLAVVALLTLRSAQVGRSLHPFTRALANEWVHLLFYVETVTRVPVWPQVSPSKDNNNNDGDDDDDALVPVTLPHFLLEAEEEVAANVEDEFFGGGFAARASSLPVGMLFTVDETKQHLHGAVANYFRLADVALDDFVLAGDSRADLPLPELLVRYENGSDTVDASFVLTGKSESEWPEPLRRDHASPRTRAFFDSLDAMQLRFSVGMFGPLPPPEHSVGGDDQRQHRTPTAKMFEWRVAITYDLQSQSHLEVAISSALQQRGADVDGGVALEDLPPLFFDTSAAFNCALLALIYAYQCVELAIKWLSSKSAAALRSQASGSPPQRPVRIALTEEARDIWFWGVLLLNLATMVCFVEAWRRPYHLALRDGLCLAFATCCALQWISLVRYLGVNARFLILGLTLQRGLPRVAQFLVGVLPVFVGYVLFGTILFGAHVPRFQSASATATTLFSVANGDEIHDTFNAVAYTPWVGQLYVYSYMIVFSYVVLMVCIGIIEDAFFSAVFPASWPSLDTSEREQAEHSQRQKNHAQQPVRGYDDDEQPHAPSDEQDDPRGVSDGSEPLLSRA
ncbi:hypothetical protein PybrP1_005637 [[Pythium] brassicae (nom. inval.)]|nr:hypothetical protein PybrP1_005637 [[Pythium] brassicae (nom. inval.)]